VRHEEQRPHMHLGGTTERSGSTHPHALAASHQRDDIQPVRRMPDVTPELRALIKLSAFQRGMIMANLLRGLLARELPDKAGDVA
jgi:hypothetical protein